MDYAVPDIGQDMLVVDIDALYSTKGEYSRCCSDLRNAMLKASEAIELLRNSGWKSDASAAFFRLYSSAWQDNMEKHIKYIDHLSSCLDKAISEYEVVYQQLFDF